MYRRIIYTFFSAFTIVELTITTTILVLLATLSFLSLRDFASLARDSVRISDIKSIEKSLLLSYEQNGYYPIPDYPLDVFYSGGILWSQGVYASETRRGTRILSQVPEDPYSHTPYAYSLSADGRYYELAAAFERDPIAFIPQVSAIGKKAYTYVTGNYNGIILSLKDISANYHIFALPTLIASDLRNGDIEEIFLNGSLAVEGENILPASYQGSNFQTYEFIGDTPLRAKIFHASKEELSSQDFQIALLDAIQKAYRGTIFTEKNRELANIVDIAIDPSNPSFEVQVKSCAIVKYYIDSSIYCGGIEIFTSLFEELMQMNFDWLPNGQFHFVHRDIRGNLWFGTNAGIGYYDTIKHEGIMYTTVDGLISNKVYAMYQDENAEFWFGTNAGVSRFDGEYWTSYTTDNGLLHNHILSIYGGNDGSLWFGTNKGLSRYVIEDWESYTSKNSDLTHNQVQTIYQDSGGNLWYGTVQGLNKFDGKTWFTYSEKEGLVHNNVRLIFEDSGGNLWFGTSQGLSQMQDDVWNDFTLENSDIIGNKIQVIFEDSGGNLWFGTSQGLSKKTGNLWSSYTTADGLPSNDVYSIYEDANNSIIVITSEGFFTIDSYLGNK